MPGKPRKLGWALVAVLAVIAVVIGGYVISQHVRRALAGSGCQVGTGRAAVSLDTDQAAIAATIAGVAYQQAMPSRALDVAYAAALQESHLHNLHYGDRDSVGIFQQRPSEGWGPARKLEDPVYASKKFFQALAKVPGYRHMPVYQAAQAVQRSADGSAYRQYQQTAGRLSAAFSGHRAHAVWCWSPTSPRGTPDLAAARTGLAAAFGPVAARQAAASGGVAALLVRAPTTALGWSVAAWLVTHAGGYGLHQVGYDGWQWSAPAGQGGWTPSSHTAAAREVRAG